MTRLLPLIILATLLAAADPAHAATRIYKWVDDDGVTQYTQQPPPKGEAVLMDPDTGVGTAAPGEPQPAGGDGDGDGGADSEDAAAAGGGEPDTVEAYCERIRERVQLLAGDQPVRLKQDDGTLVTLDGDTREARRAELEAQIAEHCTDG